MVKRKIDGFVRKEEIKIKDSVLGTIKKLLGINPDWQTEFDADIILHINTVLSILYQLGVGTEEGIYITDDTSTWDDVIGTVYNLNLVKTYVYLRVRLLFDPPANASLFEAIKKTSDELEWRITAVTDFMEDESS